MRNQTRERKRNSRSVSAPTGQRSTTLPEYGLSSGLPGKTPISSRTPRSNIASSPVFGTSSQKRMQRVHLMHRSQSKTTCGPSSRRFGPCSFSSTKRVVGWPKR